MSLRFACLTLLLLAAACDDPNGPTSALDVRLEDVSGGVVSQPAVNFTATRADGALIERVEARSIEGSAPIDLNAENPTTGGPGLPTVRGTLLLRSGGTTTFDLNAVDPQGNVVTRRISLTWNVPEARHRVEELPDLGHGAGITWVGEDGVIAGWVARADGRLRPAVWHSGVLSEIPVTDSANASARGVTPDGRVLVQVDLQRCNKARAWRADVGEVVIGCGEITALRRGYEVLLADPLYVSQQGGPSTRVFDLRTGALVDSLPARVTVANDAGQSAGVQPCCYFNQGLVLHVFGGLTAGIPDEIPTLDRICDYANRWRTHAPHALDEEGNLITSLCGLVLLHTPTQNVWVSRYVPTGSSIVMSRTGGRVALLDSARNSAHLWQLPDGAAQRVVLDRDGLRLKSLVHLSTTGTIVANATIGGESTSHAVVLHSLGTP